MSRKRSRQEVVDDRRGREWMGKRSGILWMERGVRVGVWQEWDIMMDTGERVGG